METLRTYLQQEVHQVAYLFVVVLLAMGVDIVTGLIAASINDTVSSKFGRIGLFKKVAHILALILTVAITFLIPEDKDFYVIFFVMSYSILNETISILENLRKAGIDIRPFSFVVNILRGIVGKENDYED
ncbi:MAG: phage holin family protein [Streptococcaceae bacterium]|jgi:toxin secretion/phage lysis holin|nr:phage holin family protein [Streptococcaceae bacterium]